MEALLRRLALAIGVLCGLVATQAPEFAQQYRQRLAGAADELSRVVNQFNAEASNQALAPADALARLDANKDTLAQQRAAAMRGDIARLARLEATLAEFKETGKLRRLSALPIDFDPAIARAAWRDFEPAIPTGLEGFATGLFGLVLGWAATHLFAWPIRRHARRRRERLALAP
jgi:hypothetical protein